MVLFLAVSARQQAVAQKIKNFFTKWRQVQQKIPLPEMTELLITPQLPEYPKIARDVFMLLLDGKLRSRTETLKFLKPFAPPPPPPPPPPRRGRAAKAAATGEGTAPAAVGKKGKGKAVPAAAPAGVPPVAAAKPQAQSKPGKAAHVPIASSKPMPHHSAKKVAPKQKAPAKKAKAKKKR